MTDAFTFAITPTMLGKRGGNSASVSRMPESISHPDPELDTLLGEFVVAGGEIDGSHPDYVWAYCACEDSTHAVLVLKRDGLSAEYKERKKRQFLDHPCLGRPIRRGKW